MAATPYPLPRETRESAILVGNGTVGPYGPSLYKVFDTVDVKVFAKLLGATVYSDVTGNCTIAKVNPANAYDYFTVTFNAPVLGTTSWKHQARRTAERSVAVTKAGTITAAELEKELSKQASAQSELRRDIDRAFSASPGGVGGVILPGADGELMQSDGAGNLEGSGENVTSILGSTAAAAASAAAASTSAATALAWAATPENTPVPGGGGLFSALHYAAKAAALVASVTLPAAPVANSFLQRNAGNTAYVALTPDNARLALVALKGQDIANFAGADETAKIAAMYVAAPTQPYIYRADSHIGLIRDTAPLNYATTRAAFVIQRRDAGALGFNELVPGIVTQLTATGDGVVNAGTESSSSIYLGNYTAIIKSGDSSAHGHTVIGELRAVGAGGYNELGGFQTELTNNGSALGYISAFEALIKDSPNAGVSTYSTRMFGAATRIQKYNATARLSANYLASSEGPLDIDAAFIIHNQGSQKYKTGINLLNGVFSTGQAIVMPNNTAVAGRNAAGNASLSLLFLDGSDHTWVQAGGKSKNIFFANSDLEKQFSILSTDNAVNNFEVSGSITGGAPLHWVIGSDANIGAGYGTKGTGVHSFYTGGANFYKQLEIANVTSAVNFLQINGSLTTAALLMAAKGTDANVGIGYATQGTGVHSFLTNATAKQLEISHVAATVNWVTIAGSAGTVVAVSAGGAGADVDLLLSGKANGLVTFPVAQIAATATLGANGAPPAQVSGYMKMKLSGNVPIRVPYYNV